MRFKFTDATTIDVLEIHELAAGKLAALLSRRRARDQFDCRQLLRLDTLDRSHLRTAFVVCGAMNRWDWRTVAVDDVDSGPRELSSQLLLFDEEERAFLDPLLGHGEIDGALLTTDEKLQRRIKAQPWLEWKAQNVLRHQGLP